MKSSLFFLLLNFLPFFVIFFSPEVIFLYLEGEEGKIENIFLHFQAHTATRAPAMCNGHAMLEHMMEHSAAEMNVNVLELRMNNLMMEGSPVIPPPSVLNVPCPVEDIVNQLKTSSDFDKRKADAAAFNQVTILC